MALYALSVQPLITSLQAASSTKQCWFADDACGAGSVLKIKKWWDVLNSIGPVFGYFPNPKKCWIISKPDKETSMKEVFKDTAVNVTVEGQKHLGQRFPPLANRVAPVSLYQTIVPTKCLRNQLGMVRSITIGRFNWCSLTSASPPLTKIIDRRKTFIDLASFRLFLREDY